MLLLVHNTLPVTHLEGPCSTLEMSAADLHAIWGVPCIHGPKVCVQRPNVVEDARHLIFDVRHIVHNAGVYVIPVEGVECVTYE